MRNPITAKDWDELEIALRGYFKLPLPQRSRFLFRGQGDATWSLDTTLDRLMRSRGISVNKRESLHERLIAEFLHLGSVFIEGSRYPATPIEAEILARHHGVPSRILDWSKSPWIAVYFAAACGSNADFCLWIFDRQAYSEQVSGDDPIEIIDDPERLRFNTRAIEQDGVAMVFSGSSSTLVETLAPAIWRIQMPGAIRQNVLDRLFSMRITERTLFRTLDAAAKTATWRVCEEFVS